MTATTTATGTGVAGTRRSGHLHEIDLLRLLTFASVIGVHTLSFADPPPAAAWNALEALLHFTRQVFFGLTGFVLVYAQMRRPRPLAVFWPKRFLLVGVPYVAWSFVYVWTWWLTSASQHHDLAKLVTTFSQDLVTGSARYHMYFLLVTMQVYLIVPALTWLGRRTFRTQLWALAVALVVQTVVLTTHEYTPDIYGPALGWVQDLFPTYLFPIVGGAVAAAHGPAFLAWVRTRRTTVVVLVASCAAAMLAVYGIQLALGQSPTTAATEMQPFETVWSSAAGIGLLAVGAAWADRRSAQSRTSRFVGWASDRSFGVYLAHPLVIWAVLLGHTFEDVVPPQLRFPALYVMAAVGALLISDVMRRTPASMPFTGRPWARPGRADQARPSGADGRPGRADRVEPANRGRLRVP